MLICNHCGKTLELTGLKTYQEVYGHTSLGNVIAQTFVDYDCPYCTKGEFVKATKCEICGEWFDNEENPFVHICDKCFEENKTLEKLLIVGEENTTDVYINGFVKTLLGDKKINDILVEYVRRNYTDKSAYDKITEYVDEDKIYFADWCISQVKAR